MTEDSQQISVAELLKRNGQSVESRWTTPARRSRWHLRRRTDG
ncbi:hypothetical protein ACETU7_33015 [Rhodococcus sp. 3Y1]